MERLFTYIFTCSTSTYNIFGGAGTIQNRLLVIADAFSIKAK